MCVCGGGGGVATKISRLNISVVRTGYFQLRMLGCFFLVKETAEVINKNRF